MGSDPSRQPHYQPVEYFTYWPVLGYFNNYNIIQFNNKTTTNKNFDVVNQVVLTGISDNMSSLAQNEKYSAINIAN